MFRTNFIFAGVLSSGVTGHSRGAGHRDGALGAGASSALGRIKRLVGQLRIISPHVNARLHLDLIPY